MTTLAPKLPYSHPFAGGYPRIGGQPLPTDPDAIDYLQRQAAVDGPVEVGVAMAVDAFVKGCKADGIWSAIKASCIMAGARTISGALVPLMGDAPTPYNFTASDYSRTTGLKGDGSTTYLDSGRANDADAVNDKHIASYISAHPTVLSCFIGSAITSPSSRTNIFTDTSDIDLAVNSSSLLTFAPSSNPVFAGVKLDQTTMSARYNGSVQQTAVTAVGHSLNSVVFARDVNGSIGNFSDARLAFYSIGSALDLAALDARVTNLINGIQFWNYTGLSPHAYDPDTIAYVVAGYAAGGTL